MLTQQEMKELYYSNNRNSILEEEDPRKTALKKGLRQLTVGQLYRMLDFVYCDGKLILDEYNYKDGNYCPLAVALGLDKIFKEPTNDKVFAVLALMGYSVLNTRNVEGAFYRDNRLSALLEATKEVIKEKEKEND